MSNNRIDLVHVISQGEQIAFVMTPQGNAVVTPIPDARYDTLDDVYVLAQVNTLDEAQQWFADEYGLSPQEDRS